MLVSFRSRYILVGLRRGVWYDLRGQCIARFCPGRCLARHSSISHPNASQHVDRVPCTIYTLARVANYFAYGSSVCGFSGFRAEKPHTKEKESTAAPERQSRPDFNRTSGG